jgi:hypothetical protein
MAPRTIGLHIFCSAKGGVGKSTLAVATAKLLVEQGRTCVLIDADLTGTSLADGLRICAPSVALDAEGHPDLAKPPTGRHLTRQETVRLRNLRGTLSWDSTQPSPSPPFLNDALRYVGDDGGECQVEALFWRHEDKDKVLYLPSSPARRDIGVALGWLYDEEEFGWIQRMTWFFDGMCEQMPALTDVVVDLPPGLFGFAHQMLALTSNLERHVPFPSSGYPSWEGKIFWKTNVMLVTTPDRADLFAAVEYATRYREELGHVRLLLNKSTKTSPAQVESALREQFGAEIARIPLTPVGEMRSTLGQVFANGKLDMTEEVRGLREALRIGE